MSIGKVVLQSIAYPLQWFVRERDRRRDYRDQKIEELARAVLDYGRLIIQLYPQEDVLVDEMELAFRFRETRPNITRALYRLERQGQAEPLDFDGQWRLQTAEKKLT